MISNPYKWDGGYCKLPPESFYKYKYQTMTKQWQNVSLFLGICEPIARDSFQGACDHNHVQATGEPRTVQLIFDMLLLTKYSLFKVGSEHKPCVGASLWFTYSFLVVKNHLWKYENQLPPVMSKYHEMDTNEYLNIFGCHIMYRTNIQIYLDETYLPNEYPNIFILRK